MTTWIASSLLLELDPGFDFRPSLGRILQWRTEHGTWRVFGPEEPWMTLEIMRWLEATQLPFTQRFRWPTASSSDRDRKTGIPSYAWFAQVADALASIPTLATSDVELAFVDLAGFKRFNDGRGQDAGDAAIACFARHLAATPEAVAVRDGGDEFIVMGVPTGGALLRHLEQTCAAWPQVFFQRFGDGDPLVVPRIVHGRIRGSSLRDAREVLGREITALKREAPAPIASAIKSLGALG